MKRRLFLSIILFFPLLAGAQSYQDSLLQYRESYKAGLLVGAHPLKVTDTSYLRFYDPDPGYRVKAFFSRVSGKKPFLMHMKNGGKQIAVCEYGTLYFTVKGATVTLIIYRLLTRPEDNTDASIRLFIPFADNTNYKETFGGGRYLDVSADELSANEVMLDFNKAYNPHTAYEKGYPYLIVPRGNYLPIGIKARKYLAIIPATDTLSISMA